MNIMDLRRQHDAGAITKRQFIHQVYSSHAQLFEYVPFLRDTNVRALEITEEGLALTLKEPPIQMYCAPGDERNAAIEAMNLKSYESAEFAMVRRLFEGGKNFFDIGANAGFYSLGIASHFPAAAVNAFEPVPATYDQLSRNVSLNGLANIATHCMGFSDHAGELTLYLDPSVSAATSSARPEPGGGEIEEVVCRIDTLDDFVAKSRCAPDFIKCDVEGAELFVFQGGRKLLEHQRPVVFAEMLRKWALRFGYHPNEMIRYFAELGYRCYHIFQDGLRWLPEMTDDTIETNFFFLHAAQHAGLQERFERRYV